MFLVLFANVDCCVLFSPLCAVSMSVFEPLVLPGGWKGGGSLQILSIRQTQGLGTQTINPFYHILMGIPASCSQKLKWKSVFESLFLPGWWQRGGKNKAIYSNQASSNKNNFYKKGFMNHLCKAKLSEKSTKSTIIVKFLNQFNWIPKITKLIPFFNLMYVYDRPRRPPTVRV